MLCRNQQLNLWWNEKIGVKISYFLDDFFQNLSVEFEP